VHIDVLFRGVQSEERGPSRRPHNQALHLAVRDHNGITAISVLKEQGSFKVCVPVYI